MEQAMFTLIEGGEVFAPRRLGQRDILLAGRTIAGMADRFDRDEIRRIAPELRTVDARDCLVLPGLIDPHAHFIGAGGEQGFLTRMSEIEWTEFARNGVTTAVGCLGTDAISRSLPSLLAKSRELEERGLTTFMYTGSFQVPPPTLTGSLQSDIMMIDKIVGVGEVAIADVRSSQPTVAELARIVAGAAVAGKMAGKCGVTHFHVGPSAGRLTILNQLLDHFDLEPPSIYPTHVTRTDALLNEAIALAERGCFVDTDSVEQDTATWIHQYFDRGGAPDRLTVSSDAHTPGGSVEKLYHTLARCVLEEKLDLEQALPCFTSNAAAVLKLPGKGRLFVGGDSDLVVVERHLLTIRHVVGRGRLLVEDQKINAP